jgi:hypothetical protein
MLAGYGCPMRNRCHRSAVAAALLAALLVGARVPALAGPPYQTDDPEPTAYRHFEIYSGSQYAHDPDSLSGTLPFLELNYGLMPNVQFSVSGALTANQGTGQPWKTSYGDTEVGLKLRFLPEAATRPQIAFYPAIVLPTGNAAAGLGCGTFKTFLPFWAQKTVGPYTVFGGGGLWLNPGPGNKNSTFSGLAVEREVTKRLSFGGELFYESADTIDGHGSTGFSVGSTIALDKHHSVLFSVGRSLLGSNALTTYAAYEWYLGPRGDDDDNDATDKVGSAEGAPADKIDGQ